MPPDMSHLLPHDLDPSGSLQLVTNYSPGSQRLDAFDNGGSSKGLQKWMARESRSLFMALRNSVFPETELHEVTSSSEVGDQSPLVKRLDVELRQSDQKGEAVVTGPRRCIVLTRSQYVWIASNIMKVTVPHQKPPRNKQTYIVLVQVSSTSIGSSVTPNSIKLMLYILIPLFD